MSARMNEGGHLQVRWMQPLFLSSRATGLVPAEERENKASRRRPEARLYRYALCCVVLLMGFASAQQITPWNKIQAPPLPAFAPPQPTRVQLANGMVIFLQPDPELPL